jgi:hypothetical protein
MSYEIDRDPAVEPSLQEMTEAAINTLTAATADSKKGKPRLTRNSTSTLCANKA